MPSLADLRKPQIPYVGIAAFDVIATIAVAILYSMVRDVTAIGSIVLFFTVAIGVHHVLGIPTRLNAYMGLNTHEAVDEARLKASSKTV
jgi:hypothetical protein